MMIVFACVQLQRHHATYALVANTLLKMELPFVQVVTHLNRIPLLIIKAVQAYALQDSHRRT